MADTRIGLSRRGLLKKGVAATAAGAAFATQGPAVFGQAPAVVTARRFRAWVTRGGGADRTTLQELTLRPIAGRQIVVRTEATNLCYSNVSAVLSLQPPPAAPAAAGAAPGRGTPPPAPATPGQPPAGGRPAGPGPAAGPGPGRAGGAPAGGRGFGGPARAIIQGH